MDKSFDNLWKICGKCVSQSYLGIVWKVIRKVSHLCSSNLLSQFCENALQQIAQNVQFSDYGMVRNELAITGKPTRHFYLNKKTIIGES